MVSALSFSNLYSHPGRPLEEHLINTARITVENLTEKSINILKKDKLIRLARICGLCHDLGKTTAYFQKYLFASEEEKKELKSKKETRHGLLSAVACYYAVKKEFEGDNDMEGDEKAFLCFIAFLSVKRHHGDLEDVIEEVIVTDKDIEVLFRQIDSINGENFSTLIKHLERAGLRLKINKDLLKEWAENIPKELKAYKRKLRKLDRDNSFDPYLLANFLFSILIDADKSEVGIGEILERRKDELNPSLVDKYKATLGFEDTYLNKLRETAYREVLEKPICFEQRILSINLPTGMGKTFTSLAFALKLRNEVEKKKGIKPRIIYSLPFLSIIEQNADQFEKMLKACRVRIDTSLLLKHHHLSEVYYIKGNDEFELDEAKILIEGWNSEIIVTTFVQFFHTLVSNRNSSLRKFHRLANSIIVLDEVQAVPCKYWMMVRELLKNLTEKFDSYVIFVTATEPMIFRRDEIYPLVNRIKYFEKMDRIVVKPRLEEDMNLEEFIKTLELQKDKSYLFILNTIKSAKAFYDLLKSIVGDEDVIFLSTHVVPFERLERIEKMRRRKARLAVTTQLVEAGVDIDFDVVYRDLAPLDSINQAAGRCNRNWGKKGEVIVVSLRDENRRYSSYIYDSILLDITRRILEKYKTISEKQFLELIDDYYKELLEKKSSDESRKLLFAVYKMKYDSVDGSAAISDFRLISEDYPKFDVFVEINDEAKRIWERYMEIKKIKNLLERRLAFSRIKADFYKYTVAVPYNVKNIPPIVEGFGYVNQNSLKDYYDEETGFKCEGELAIW
ncbi:MAG: CRISPR-associated endonuclease/helicase Cas3 [Thermosediminibacterales bacterium]|nr:CRISPR-associated endonuclease/helicase Cas3 [Thermosediminibacterales bacterium]MDK2835975.1 CRISPR-associated endonuclease/helicase Cas3 [Thermosediminibacterales bacterium]